MWRRAGGVVVGGGEAGGELSVSFRYFFYWIWNRQLMGTVLQNESVALMWPVVAYFKWCISYSG